jgi:hypothetical protein
MKEHFILAMIVLVSTEAAVGCADFHFKFYGVENPPYLVLIQFL